MEHALVARPADASTLWEQDAAEGIAETRARCQAVVALAHETISRAQDRLAQSMERLQRAQERQQKNRERRGYRSAQS